ncbi:MAG: DNA mismatch repair endonuclease MutL [Clostridiales bacterium]|nr:DNA mismatch repair endonuclease MutL [Clostridiales bacterium]
MGKIVLLDDLTINQIAAGEVIERPASVVKELVENSIDAGARKITVDIKNGGISYIRITDDGYGIMPDDMEIAFERHATSKIRESRDLEYVRTMGFRGEALASIGAIAKVQMLSKAIGQDNGYQVEVEGGDIIDKHEAGCAPGTSITVKELFYNTPVRYKFLKKDFTESGYIEDAIKRLALVNPNISFKFINNGKIELQTSGNGRMEDVVYAIYGKEVLENIIPVDYQYEDIYIKGVIGKPMIARSNRANQLFFVNKRFIKDKTLSSAAEQGFKGLVTIGKHGFLILNLDMDPKKLDVNVHPTKMEVRFQEESKIFKAVFHAVKDTMLKTDLITNHEKEHFSDDKVDFDKDVKNDNLTNSARLKFWGLNKEEKFNEKENKDFDFFKNLKSPNVKSMDAVQDTPYGEKSEFEVDDKIGKINEELDKIQKSRNNKIEYNLNRYDHLGENASVADKMNLLNDTVGNDYGMINDEEKEIKNTNSENQEENKDIVNDSLSNVTESNVNDDKFKTEEIEVIDDIKSENLSEELKESNNSEIVNEVSEGVFEPEIESNIADNKVEESQVNYEYEKNETLNESKLDEVESNNDKKSLIEDKDISFEEKYRKLFGRDIQTAKEEYQIQRKNEDVNLKPIEGEKVSLFENKDNDIKKPHYNYVGIAFKTYIIFTINDEMYMMDQHAAHERIMFEKVKANYYNDVDKDSQLMLLPDIITLSNKEMGIFRDNKELFNKAGFTVDEFGDNTVKLTGVPEFCLDFDTRSLFLETLDEMDTVARTAKQELEYKFLATVACKSAVKAHMALSKEEVDSLFEQLYKLPNPFSCPHGRPTVIKMTKTDIEKKFSRIQ